MGLWVAGIYCVLGPFLFVNAMSFRTATINVRGLRDSLKREAFFLSVAGMALDFVFLQECHLRDGRDVGMFSRGWGRGPSRWGVGNVHADGVGIIFGSWEVVIEVAVCVVPGRVLVVDCRWRGVRLRLLNVYAPSVRSTGVTFPMPSSGSQSYSYQTRMYTSGGSSGSSKSKKDKDEDQQQQQQSKSSSKREMYEETVISTKKMEKQDNSDMNITSQKN